MTNNIIVSLAFRCDQSFCDQALQKLCASGRGQTSQCQCPNQFPGGFHRSPRPRSRSSQVQLFANARDFFNSSRWLLACVTIMRMASWETTAEAFSRLSRRFHFFLTDPLVLPGRPGPSALTHLVGGVLIPLELVTGPVPQVLPVCLIRNVPDGFQHVPVDSQDLLPLQELHTEEVTGQH